MDSKQLATRIKRIRKAKGLSQEELAQRADLSYSTVSKIEQATISNPSIWTILSLSKALLVSLNELLGIEEKTSQNSLKQSVNPIKLVVFDLHGVLLEGLDNLFATMAHTYHADPLRLEELFWQFDNLVTTGKMSVATLNERMGHILEIDNFDFFGFYIKHFKAHTPVQTLLPELHAKGIKLGILTMVYPGAYELLEANAQVPPASLFSVIARSYEIGEIKPDNAYYEYIEAQTGSSPQQVLYLDDTQIITEHANKWGWQTLLYDQSRSQEGIQQLKQSLGI